MLKKRLPPRWALATMLLLCLLPEIGIIFLDEELWGHWGLTLSFSLLSIALVALLPALGGRRGVGWLGAFWLLWAPAEISCHILAKTPISFGLIQATFQTNSGEAKDLLGVYLIITLITLLLWAFYGWSWKSWHHRSLPITWRARITILTISLGVIWGLSTTLSSWRTFPLDIFYNTWRYLQRSTQEEQAIKQLTTGNFEVINAPLHNEEAPIILYVIGETSSANHWQQYGYQRATTPLLTQNKDVLFFSNVSSCSTLTSIALPMMISRSTPQQCDLWQQEGTLLHLFREAQFTTAWFTNHDSPFKALEASMPVIDLFRRFDPIEDTVLLPALDSLLYHRQKDTQPVFIVLHSMGSHFRYDRRSPKSFDTFTPTLRGIPSGLAFDPINRTRYINSYDNTIRYTDYFLSQIIQRVKQYNRPMIMLFAPDHGEGLGEQKRLHLLHGSEWPLEDELHIPMLIAYNEAYAHRNPVTVSRLKQHINTPISAAELPNLIISLADVKIKEPSLTWLDQQYTPSERYYLSPSLTIRPVVLNPPPFIPIAYQ